MVEQRVLAVDDDPAALEAIVALLRQDGYEVDSASSAEDAERLLQRFFYPLIVTDLVLPGKSGIDLVRYAGRWHPQTTSIVVTGHGTLRTAVEALKAGAVDYLTKPVDPAQLRALISSIMEAAEPSHPNRKLAPEAMEMNGMASRCPPMRAVFEKIRLASDTESIVLLQGESGTGKELCAKTLHQRSRRSAKTFSVFHAGGISPERVQGELFGWEENGVRRQGKLEQARGGTLFIEEIDALDARSQEALVEFIERSGSFDSASPTWSESPPDVRLIAGTHRNLSDMVGEGKFREDLYYRLSIFPIEIPPLRQRRDDIPLLVQNFLELFSARYRKTTPQVPPETMDLLLKYDWPGNVRELRNVVEHAVILCMDGTLGPELLPRMLHTERPQNESIQIAVGTRMKDVERTVIARTLDAYHWNKNKTAKILGISRRSLYNKLERYQIIRRGERQSIGEFTRQEAVPLAEGDR